ncbi:MAG: RNA 2',3'-cyclic phosphodiesterase [Actinomycetota bacterium]
MIARDRAARPEAKPLRLFVALDVPAGVRDLVEEAVSPIRERYPRARWVPKQNQHVTLKFLGSTWPRLVGWVGESIESVTRASERFTSRVSAVGAFPAPRRARVLWAGLEDAGGRITALATALDDALGREFQPEKRAFTPHLTVARFDPPVGLEEELRAVSSLAGEPFAVEGLVLYRSHLQRPAPIYEALGEFRLGG